MLDIAQKQKDLALKVNNSWQEIKRSMESPLPANWHDGFGEEEGRNTLVK